MQVRGPGLKPSAELPADWQGSGFTPAARHLPRLIEVCAERELGEAAERALVRAGLPGAEAAFGALGSAPPAARARLARVLSRVAVAEPDALRPKLLALLGDAEARVQRAAIVGLGKIGGAGVEAALLALWSNAALPERRALAEALGKVGGEDSRRFLDAEPSADPELERRRGRAQVMLGRELGRTPRSLDVDRALPHPVTAVLLCRRGLAEVLEAEARERGLALAVARSSSEVVLPWSGPLRPLLEVRTALQVGVEVALAPASSTEASVIAALLASAPLLAALGSGVPRFRLAWPGGKHQRARTFHIAGALDPKILVNDPRDAPWEARVGERLLLIARPERDLRFGYRGPDVPAASHPTIAAALARLAGARADDVVWDPFVGSGLELCERGLLGPFRRLIGSDVSDKALRAARENLGRAGLSAELARGDARSHAPRGVTLVVTNPPMGRRVARRGELAGLIQGFIVNVARVLGPGGRLVWLSPLPEQSARELGARGFALERRGAVDLGGFSAELQLGERTWTSPGSGAKLPPP